MQLLVPLALSTSLVFAADHNYQITPIDLHNLSDEERGDILSCCTSQTLHTYFGESSLRYLENLTSSILLKIFTRVYDNYEKEAPDDQKVNKHFIVRSHEGKMQALVSFATYIFERPEGHRLDEPWIGCGLIISPSTDQFVTTPILESFMASQHINFLPDYKLIRAMPTELDMEQWGPLNQLGAQVLGDVTVPLCYYLVFASITGKKTLWEIPLPQKEIS